MSAHDAVVIGSGHNGLVAAAYMARAGLDVAVLERNAVAGGAVASEELTEPGFVHDTFSSWHPLFKLSAAFAELGDELAIDYVETPQETTANVRSRRAHGDRLPRPRADRRGLRRRATARLPAPRSSASARRSGSSAGCSAPSCTRRVRRGSRRSSRCALRRRGTLSLAADVVSSARAWFETRFAGLRGRRPLRAVGAPRRPAPRRRRLGLSGARDRGLAARRRAAGRPRRRGGLRARVRAADRRRRRHDRDRRRGDPRS